MFFDFFVFLSQDFKATPPYYERGIQMRESILTIPVNEVFEPKKGCPICAMRNTIEQHICEYIMGAAMMEPDVRIETNAAGFCREHFNGLLRQDNRLSLALMLDTRLQTLRSEVYEKKGIAFTPAAKLKKSAEAEQTCFVCDKVNWGVSHTLETVFSLYKGDEGFRKLFSEQEYLCLPHYNLLVSKASEKLPKKERAAFISACDELIGSYIKSLNDDVHEFCTSFDYRNAGKLHNEDMEHIRNSIERAIEFLTSRKPEAKK